MKKRILELHFVSVRTVKLKKHNAELTTAQALEQAVTELKQEGVISESFTL